MVSKDRVTFSSKEIVEKATDAEVLSRYAYFLRIIADYDYITARLCMRSGLTVNFLWSSLQALEKYLKATLLFNTLSKIPCRGHVIFDLIKLINSKIGALYDFTEKESEFLLYLEEVGGDRYAVENKYVLRKDVGLLDSCVWKIRMYCRKMYKGHFPDSDTNYRVEKIEDWNSQDAIYGLLEGLSTSTTEWHLAQLDALRWNNAFFNGYLLPQETMETFHLALVPDWGGDEGLKQAATII